MCMQAAYSQGRRQEFKEGGAELKGCEAPSTWRGDRKPHLLINDSFPGIVIVPGVSGCTCNDL